MGRRVKKGGTTFTYDSDGRLIKQSNGFEFFYDASGVAGFKYSGAIYFYRKDAQGNIIAILNKDGIAIIKYYYDAWGNSKTLYLLAVDKAESYRDTPAPIYNDDAKLWEEIAVRNPFRYRGYYYDTETGLYYLQTRYYDPEVGRFISQDSIEYADPETVNGLNLYAYCGNNPVMNIDPTGELFFALFLGITALIGLGLTIGGVASGNNTLTAVGLTMVAIPALISGGMALVGGIAAGATFTSVVGGITIAAGLGTGLFASAEIQQASGQGNWMLDAGMSKEWYYGLMLAFATVATIGTAVSSFANAFKIKSIQGIGRYGKYGQKGYFGIKFTTGAGKTQVLTFHTHSHIIGKTISQWHWQLQKWNPRVGEAAGTIASWIWWNLKRM